MKTLNQLLFVVAFLGILPPVHAQMVNPSIDHPDEPFCYFSNPTDEIGVMDGKEATLVSPEGFLFTGYGEMMFFTGSRLEPIHQRVKTLYKGYLPVVDYRYQYDGFDYQFRVFASTLDGNPESPLIDFIRITIANKNTSRRNAFLATGIRYQNEINSVYGIGDNRFSRPAKSKRPGGFNQPGVKFDPASIYGFNGNAFVRGGKVLYLFPISPMPELRMTLKDGDDDVIDTSARSLRILPTTPAGIAKYKIFLRAGEEQTLDFLMPVEPLTSSDPLIGQLQTIRFDEYFQMTVSRWDSIISRGMEISLPEQKVVNTFKASLVYDLIARNKVDSFYIQTVNDFHYHAFWLRDASYIVNMYDLTGYHDVARQCLDFFPQFQQPDGNFVSQGGQFDGWGQTLWAYGGHFMLSHDSSFARRVLPAVQCAMIWLDSARKSDTLHLIPATAPGDNEDIRGHITGHNFNALGGIKYAILLANAAGRDDLAFEWLLAYRELFTTLMNVLHTVTVKTDGYIPPGLDTLGGQDWGNMESVYPVQILDPFDPMVTATLKATRAKYQEGIMTYGDGRWMHHYLTISNTETEVVRGEQQTALEELYALLVHTSATHAGFEFDILPWSTRDFNNNLSPHGWFAAKYRALLRNMLVREENSRLHLLSVASPEWLKNGDTIAVRRAPTAFGTVNFTLVARQNGATLILQNNFLNPPDSLVLHLPWFLTVRQVTADGSPVRVSGNSVLLPADVHTVQITWQRSSRTTPLSYDRAVKGFKTEFGKRWKEFIEGQ